MEDSGDKGFGKPASGALAEGNDHGMNRRQMSTFLGDKEDAEEARAERVGVIARRFYQELPAALAGARQRGRMSARERASQKWKRGKDGETMH